MDDNKQNKIMAIIFKIREYFKEHTIRSVVVVLAVILAGYWGYGKFFPTVLPIQYITETAERQTITVSVSSGGQVLESNKMDLKPLSSGNIIAVNVKNGDVVKAGQAIAVIDQKDSLVALNQARASLLTAQANYKKLADGATADDIRISQNSVNQAELNYKNSQTNLESVKKTTSLSLAEAQKAYDDIRSLNTSNISNSQRDVVIATLGDKLFSGQSALDSENKILTDDKLKNTFSVKDASYGINANEEYTKAQALLIRANADLSVAKGHKSDANIEQAVNSALEALDMTLSSLNDCFNALRNSVASSDISQTSIDSYKSSMSSQITGISSAISSVKTEYQDLKDAMATATENLDTAKADIIEKVAAADSQMQSAYNSWQSALNSLNKLKTPATDQDLQISRAQIISAQAQFDQATINNNNNVITAPFDGQIAAIKVQKGDPVTDTTVIATIITKQLVATVALNEVDVAKVKIGQKAVLTFDAIDGLSLTGKVNEIDTIGTVSQNVVTYNVQIVLDTQDERIRSGMSTNAEIINDVRVDVLAVPNSALKSDLRGSYVQVLGADGKPENVIVKTGIANDIETEITDGLAEGSKVITQTIDPNVTVKTATPGNSGTGFRIPGVGGR